MAAGCNSIGPCHVHTGAMNLACKAGAVLFCCLLLPAQEPPVIRVTARTVEVQVLVEDRSGKPVAGLSRKDFILTDGREPQKISAFSEETKRLVKPPSLAPGEFTNAATLSSVTLVMFDKLNTRIRDQNYARRELIEFLKQAGPEERIAIVALGRDGNIQIISPALPGAEALDRAAADRNQASHLLLMGEIDKADPGDIAVDEGGAAAADAIRGLAEDATKLRMEYTMRAFEAIARHLSRVPGRKNLVWISGAFPFSIGFGMDQIMEWRVKRQSFEARVAHAAHILTDSNVAVYPVDARGLTGAPMTDTTDWSQGFGIEGAQTPASVINARESMKSLAEATGGRAYYGGNKLSAAIRQAVDDAATIYTLSYQPAHGKWDGRFRRIEVRVKRDGATVRHRRGYFAVAEASGEQSQQHLTTALWSPMEATGLGLSGFIGRKLELLVESDHITMEPKGQLWTGALEIMLSQQSAEGRNLRTTEFLLPLRVDKQTFEGSFRRGVGIAKEIDIVPRAARLRIAVRDRPSGRIGTLTIPLRPESRK